MKHIMHPKVCWQCDSISSASYPFLNWIGSCKPGVQLGCGSPCLPVSTVDIDHITHLKLDVSKDVVSNLVEEEEEESA